MIMHHSFQCFKGHRDGLEIVQRGDGRLLTQHQLPTRRVAADERAMHMQMFHYSFMTSKEYSSPD